MSDLQDMDLPPGSDADQHRKFVERREIEQQCTIPREDEDLGPLFPGRFDPSSGMEMPIGILLRKVELLRRETQAHQEMLMGCMVLLAVGIIAIGVIVVRILYLTMRLS